MILDIILALFIFYCIPSILLYGGIFGRLALKQRATKKKHEESTVDHGPISHGDLDIIVKEAHNKLYNNIEKEENNLKNLSY